VAVSIWQLIIIAVILGVPILMAYRSYRAMREPHDDLVRPLRSLTRNLVASLLATVFFFVVSAATVGSTEPVTRGPVADGLFSLVLLVLAFVMLGSSLKFWVALGMLSSRLGRSPIVWIGLPIITSPIGPFVAYFWMRGLAKAAITGRVLAPVSAGS
jgi:hypothetical protein